MAPTITPYTGPRPAPSHRWAPWVLAATAALIVLHVASTVVNLWERSILGDPVPSAAQVATTHQLLSALKVTGRVTLFFVVAFLVVDVTWSRKRRPRGRGEAHREQEVEPRLRTVSPGLNTAMWCALFSSIAAARLASAKLHLGMTRHDFVGYRSLLAGSHAASVLLWGCFMALALKAHALQRARESQPTPS